MKIKRFILLAFSGCCLALSGAACSGLEGDNSDFDFGDMTSDAPDNPYDGQGYDRLPNSVRLATYNTHRCEGWTQNSGTDRANYNNTAKVISLMPVFTAGVGQDWIYTDDGKPQYWAIDNYFITGERNTHFLGCDVVKQHHTLTQIIMGLLNNGFELKVVEEADFLEEFDPRYNEEGVSELDEQFERLPDGHEAKRSYYLGFRQAQSEARPNIVISLLKLN